MIYAVSRTTGVALALLAVFVNAAEPARQLTWDDLVPPQALFDDPFEKLDPDQLYDLSMVARLRERQAKGDTDIPEDALVDAAEAEQRLLALSIDVDGLLARRQEITEKRRARAQATNPELNGKKVRIPGYLLPLEFEGTGVTEFLLVPFVGACIHVPPPPPNQIVHVRSERAVEIPGLYAPVWVNGTLATEQRTTQLSLVDGVAPVPVGYTLRAEQVELYE